MKDSHPKNDFDVIIIGGGAAGLSAALWCDDLNLNALLLESSAELGGQLLRVHNAIENYLGIETKNGRELRDVFVEQIEKRDFTLKLSSEVCRIDLENKTIWLKTGEEFTAEAIVAATGIRRRKLNVEGEEKFKNRGIIESGKREQNSVRGKNATVVGGGDAALENALILAEKAENVRLIHRGKDFRARAQFVRRVSAHPKIEIFTETIVREIGGRERAEFLELKNLRTGEIFKLPVDALLIRVGVEPNTELFGGKIDFDTDDYIKINSVCETNVEGVFAVGDAANPLAPTVGSAVGMGATAIKTISNRLRILKT